MYRLYIKSETCNEIKRRPCGKVLQPTNLTREGDQSLEPILVGRQDDGGTCTSYQAYQSRRKSWKIKLNKHRENSLRGSINESFLPSFQNQSSGWWGPSADGTRTLQAAKANIIQLHIGVSRLLQTSSSGPSLIPLRLISFAFAILPRGLDEAGRPGQAPDGGSFAIPLTRRISLVFQLAGQIKTCNPLSSVCLLRWWYFKFLFFHFVNH